MLKVAKATSGTSLGSEASILSSSTVTLHSSVEQVFTLTTIRVTASAVRMTPMTQPYHLILLKQPSSYYDEL